ncbi:MAG: transposase [Firmicutes bacterium]|nr:transposase [Bacillota bacterium]
MTTASFLVEVGDTARFGSDRQISKYVGYNLTENNSGKTKAALASQSAGGM